MKKTFQRTAMLVLGVVWAAMVQAAGTIMVKDAWVREAPPGAAGTAGYMVLENMGDKPRALVSASCDAFGSVMLHRTVMQDGMAKMVHQMKIDIPAGGSVVFKPKDYHIMLMKPKHALKAGDKVDITLQFKDGETTKVSYEVRTAKGDMEGMGGMKSMDHGKM